MIRSKEKGSANDSRRYAGLVRGRDVCGLLAPLKTESRSYLYTPQKIVSILNHVPQTIPPINVYAFSAYLLNSLAKFADEGQNSCLSKISNIQFAKIKELKNPIAFPDFFGNFPAGWLSLASP